ncbi:protein NATD1-like [Anguilla rostrata]|uniref:protein NATD1-like n=1 Tax=Anguilla rostrata TaxID=7938 RepID=UPI0030CEDA28
MALRLLCSHSNAFRQKNFLMCNFKTAKTSLSITSLAGNSKIEHDRHRKCFTLSLGNDAGNLETAVLIYEFTGDREVHLLTTNVPVRFRGKGVAALLAKSALDFVVEENLKARISCWYIKKYITENPKSEYKDKIVH